MKQTSQGLTVSSVSLWTSSPCSPGRVTRGRLRADTACPALDARRKEGERTREKGVAKCLQSLLTSRETASSCCGCRREARAIGTFLFVWQLYSNKLKEIIKFTEDKGEMPK